MPNITVKNKSDGSLRGLNDPFYVYKRKLNRLNELNVVQKSSSETVRSPVNKGDYVFYEQGGNTLFFGTITSVEKYGGGSYTLVCKGYEQRYAKEQSKKKTYQSSDSDVIAEDILSQSSYDDTDGTITPSITQGTHETAFTLESFKTQASSSILNSIERIKNETGQDTYIDYSTDGIAEYKLVNERGKDTGIVLNETSEFTNPRLVETEAEADVFTVKGRQTGDQQIEATAGTGDIEAPPIVDKTIVTQGEAQRLADQLEAERGDGEQRITFDYLKREPSFEIGDRVIVNSPTIDVDEKTVRVTKITRGNTEDRGRYVDIEVAETFTRRPLEERPNLDQVNRRSRKQDEGQSYEQGSKNTLSSSGLGNAKQGVPIRVPIQFTDKYINDELGNNEIILFTADVDVDPYRQEVGAVGETQVSPNLTSSTNANSHKHDPTDAGHVHSISTPTSDNTAVWQDEGSDSDFSFTTSGGSFDFSVLSEFISGEFEYVAVNVRVERNFSTSNEIFMVLQLGGDVPLQKTPFTIKDPTYSSGLLEHTFLVPVHGSVSGDVELSVYTENSNDYEFEMSVYGYNENHTHDISALTGTQQDFADVDDNNRDPNVTGAADSHDHAVTIGDNVDDSAAVNATGVTFTVQYYDGSTWVDKNTVTINDTLETEVDLSQGGTYPDQPGQWRVNVETDSTAPDLVKTVINSKHVVFDTS